MSTYTETDFRLLPKFIQSKRAILNPINNDHCSFGYAIVLYFYPNEWRICRSKVLLTQRLRQRFAQHELDKIKYPVQIDDISSIEDQLNLRINVFTFADSAGFKRHSLYISKKYKPEEINLLYWDGRFAWIKFLSRLFYDIQKYAYLTYIIILKYIVSYI